VTENIVNYEALIDALPGNFLVLQPNDPQFTILAISDDLLRIIAKKREEVVGKEYVEVFPVHQTATAAEGPAWLKASLQKAIETHQAQQLPHLRYDLPNAAGTFEERYWSVTSKPVLNAEGEVVCLIHASREVTKEVLAEKKSEKSELALRSFIAAAPFPIAIYTGREMRIQFANQAMIEAYGKGKDVVGKLYAEVLPEMDPDIFKRIDTVFLTGIPYQSLNEYMELVIEGKPRPFYYTYTFTPLRDAEGRVYGVMNTAIDVTDLSLAHKKIEESAREFSNLANAMPQLVWMAEPNGVVSYYNDRISVFAGARQRPDGSWHWQSILIPEDEQPTVAAWNKAVAEGSVYEIEHRLQMKDGRYRWHLSRAYPQKDEAGAVVKWYGTATDVHTQKENEEALRRSEEQLRIAIEAAELGTFTLYPQEEKLIWSAKTRELMGLPAGAALQIDTFYQAVHPDDRERSQALIQKALLPAHGGSYENEFRIIGISTGILRWMRSKGKVSFDAQNRPLRFTGVTQDITQRKQAE
jgi:PAS domain S-box-containing protein